MQIALGLQARQGDDARWKSHNCVMIDCAAWIEFNSGYFSPRKVGTVKIRQNRVFTLGDKWETLLFWDLFEQIRLGGCSRRRQPEKQNNVDPGPAR